MTRTILRAMVFVTLTAVLFVNAAQAQPITINSPTSTTVANGGSEIQFNVIMWDSYIGGGNTWVLVDATEEFDLNNANGTAIVSGIAWSATWNAANSTWTYTQDGDDLSYYPNPGGNLDVTFVAAAVYQDAMGLGENAEASVDYVVNGD